MSGLILWFSVLLFIVYVSFGAGQWILATGAEQRFDHRLNPQISHLYSGNDLQQIGDCHNCQYWAGLLTLILAFAPATVAVGGTPWRNSVLDVVLLATTLIGFIYLNQQSLEAQRRCGAVKTQAQLRGTPYI